ncbi:MAG TPA: hypothetical protein VM661_15450 [Candidatus Sulfotelmatobacter sp.]|jgi:hypothetical protein|nr:hypothetical protein [Candidatus Sulfotelmatobacter sp.]
MTRKLAIAAIVLWAVTAVAAAALLIGGHNRTGDDGRTVIRLAPAERDFVLSEMRGMLMAVQDITAALAKGDNEGAAHAARAAGGDSVGGVPVSLMAKLPMEFRQSGMAMHGSFDDFAAAATHGDNAVALTGRLSGLMSGCVGCHQAFRIDPAQ